jgi:ribonucleotide reductase beta subunit family protein with ferritin-like domain
MFVHENLVFNIYTHKNSVRNGTDLYQYVGRDELGNYLLEVDYSTADGILQHVVIRVCDTKYNYLQDEMHIDYFRKVFSREMAEEDIENASECGRTVFFD